MIESFFYEQPVKIHFGFGVLNELESILSGIGTESAVLVCDRFFAEKGNALKDSCALIKAVFSDVEPNPLLSGCEEVIGLAAEVNADTIIALGGGSSIDTAKFAAACRYSRLTPTEQYKEQRFPEKIAKIIAIPTTAGTGSEVTKVSVISNGSEKKSIHNPAFMPTVALLDPELTMTVPPKATMITGLDAFTHAIEAIWSVNHQPITDALATEAIKQILGSLEKAFTDSDRESRTSMHYGSLLAGLAFSVTKTAASHACSFPLTADYHVPHGEACAFTLDSFIRINADERLEKLAHEVGLESTDELADKVRQLKKLGGLRTRLSELGDVDLDKLALDCVNHPLMRNNPVQLSVEEMKEVFVKLS